MTTHDERCAASSWRGKSHRPYGPGGYNRCVGVVDHSSAHVDEWGNRWRDGGRINSLDVGGRRALDGIC